MIKTEYDLLIIGGGLVGTSLALSLRNSGLKIALIENQRHQDNDGDAFDARTIALSLGSCNILQRIGVWQQVEPTAAPINTIHISQTRCLGVARLEAQRFNRPSFGYTASANAIGQGLLKLLSDSKAIDYLCPAHFTGLNNNDDQGYTVDLIHQEQPITVTTKLVVGADGAMSSVREALGISHTEKSYQQSAVCFTIECQKPHRNVAYERFTSDGPLALLPGLESHQYCIIWTQPESTIEHVMQLDDVQVQKIIQEKMANRTGNVSRISKRSHYPLKLITIDKLVSQNALLMGNAAHTIHPVTGQGFNLGLRDVACLHNLIGHALKNHQAINSSQLLERYQQNRTKDHQQLIRYTDKLQALFRSNQPPGIKALRGLSLALFDQSPLLTEQLTTFNMGLSGNDSLMEIQ